MGSTTRKPLEEIMDLLLICRDALTSSLLDNLWVAIEAKKQGDKVMVLFTQEALAALAGGTFGWPPQLSGQERRYTMANAAGNLEVPVMASGQARQLDWRLLLDKARQLDVPMFASSLWVDLLGLENELPEGVAVIDAPSLLKTLMEADSIVGSL